MNGIVYTDGQRKLINKTDRFFIEKIPFNQYLGMHVNDYGEQPLKLRIEIRPELLGNYSRNMLHGGVTLSLLDAVGGMQVFREVIRRDDTQTGSFGMDALRKVSTISLTTQFLRPGIGQSFYATADVQRLGRKVAFVEMQMMNQEHLAIAAAQGVYSVS